MGKTREDEIRTERSQFVAKSNALIQRTRYELTLEEQRLLLYIISKIKPEDEKLKYYEFTIRDYCEVCGINIDAVPDMYNYIKRTITTLKSRTFWIKRDRDGAEEEVTVQWLDKAIMKKRSGLVAIKLDDDLAPYLLELKGLYTQYQLINVLPMKGKYSARLYEILRAELPRDRRYREVTYTLEDLQDRLGITEENGKSYIKNPTMFRKFVMDGALEEIALYTDITASAEYLKAGKKIDRVRIEIRQLKDAQAMSNSLRAERELYKKADRTTP